MLYGDSAGTAGVPETPVPLHGTAGDALGIIPLGMVAVVAVDAASLGGRGSPGIVAGLASTVGEARVEAGVDALPPPPPTDMVLGFVHCRNSQGFFILCVPPNLGLSG